MKSIDVIAQRLFATAAIIGMLLFGSAALIYSTNPATAAGPNTTYSTGKYMMSLQAYYSTGDSNRHDFYILVWDTETGRSKIYQANSKKTSGFSATSGDWALPSSPL